jgi:hypothetical protein
MEIPEANGDLKGKIEKRGHLPLMTWLGSCPKYSKIMSCYKKRLDGHSIRAKSNKSTNYLYTN